LPLRNGPVWSAGAIKTNDRTEQRVLADRADQAAGNYDLAIDLPKSTDKALFTQPRPTPVI
jgi:hypothetical protein